MGGSGLGTVGTGAAALVVALLLVHGVPGARSRRMQDTAFDMSEYAWSPEAGGRQRNGSFLGSPSILRVPEAQGGWLLASHDRFSSVPVGTVHVYRALPAAPGRAEGEEWVSTANVTGIYWANLFINTVPLNPPRSTAAPSSSSSSSSVYLLGTTGDLSGSPGVAVARSTDGGLTFSRASQVLAPSPPHLMYHCGPQPVVEYGGTLYRGMEVWGDAVPGAQGGHGALSPVVITAPTACPDLTAASCWSVSAPLPLQPTFFPAGWRMPTAGRLWEEACAVATPQGVKVLMRIDSMTAPAVNHALLLSVSVTPGRGTLGAAGAGGSGSGAPQPGFKMAFEAVVPLPTGESKFVVRRHAPSGFYYSLTNYVTDASKPGMRNVLMLARSPDLRRWQLCNASRPAPAPPASPSPHVPQGAVLWDDTGAAMDWERSANYTGFQYVDFHFDAAAADRGGGGGNETDLVMAVRAAYRGAVKAGDSNRMLYHRLHNFEALCAS